MYAFSLDNVPVAMVPVVAVPLADVTGLLLLGAPSVYKLSPVPSYSKPYFTLLDRVGDQAIGGLLIPRFCTLSIIQEYRIKNAGQAPTVELCAQNASTVFK